MLRTIAWYTHFATSLIGKIPQMYRVKSLEKKMNSTDWESHVHKITSKWAMSHVKMSGADVSVHGLENVPKDIPVVFISNHQSNFDVALIMSYVNKPTGFIAKVETLKIPLVRTWMGYINCVFMDRSSLKKSAQAIIEGVNILKAGHSLAIFPEGTRSKGGPVGDFKGGSFKLATKAKVPIVPITIKDSYKLMEANGNKIKPAKVEMYIHPMIETANLSKSELESLPETVKNIIVSKL